MRLIKSSILLIFLLLSVFTVYSQESRKEIKLEYPVNKAAINRNYGTNMDQLSEMSSFLESIKNDSTVRIREVIFFGYASPEGSYQINHRLARARLNSLESAVCDELQIADSVIRHDDEYIPWGFLSEMVSESDIPQKQEVLDIINEEPILVDYAHGSQIDSRVLKLQKLDGGILWKELHDRYFDRMRSSRVVFITYKRPLISAVQPILVPVKLQAVQYTGHDSLITPQSNQQFIVTDDWTRGLYLKTNGLGLGLAVSNVAAEIDIAKHWSFTLPVYYSAVNYFTSTIKFRTLAVQPELRYWFRNDNQRFFIGAHFGYAQYNVAVDGDFRYQDRGGDSPALGGGLSAGYRMPISRNERWQIEFTLGAGAYGLHYDKFYNVDNGKLVGSYDKTYWGIDNAAVNISYRFDLKKRRK